MPSSVIAKIDYESAHARLTVTFTTGRVYQYLMVPADVVTAFKTAASQRQLLQHSHPRPLPLPRDHADALNRSAR